MAVDETGRNIGDDMAAILQQLKTNLDLTRVGPAEAYMKEKEENRELFSNLISDLEKVLGDGFNESQKESAKFVKDMAEKIADLTQTINSGDLKTLKKKQQELRKEEKKLASFQLMKAFHREQHKQLDKQTGILQQILECCTKGSPLGTPITEPRSTPRSSGTSESIEDFTGDKTFLDRINDFFGSKKKGSGGAQSIEELFGYGSLKSPNEILFGNKNAFKGVMIQLQDISRSLLLIKSNESILGKLTEGIVETQLSYEKSMRETLYLTAGATKESTDLFRTMAKLGNTVEITGFKQEETQKALNKLARTGIKYDGDAEKYKKRILNLTTTTLNTEQQLGLEAGSLLDTFGDLYRFGTLNENSIANLGRGMREVSRTTGVSGESFKKVLGITQEIVDAMRKAATLTAASAKNITELGANAEKFGVSQEFGAINKALSSTVNLFNEASDGTRLLLFNAAASVGKLGELQAGTLTRSKEGIKALTQGVNNVFKKFGIESADAIDQLSDSAKMRLNLVLKSSFDLELGQVKGVLKTLEASGKTFADKILDLDKQLGKNISTEKRTAILEEQRKLKVDKNLDLLGILSEAAETSKTMSDAFSKFGIRRKEFESDLQALGLGGSNKDVIRQAVEQSLTGVNASLSKAGLKEISISATEMAKALEDPQAYQDLLSNLTKAEQTAAASAKNTLSGVDATNFKLDQLNATVQDKIAGPLSTFLNQGVTGIVAANAAILMMPYILGKVAALPAMANLLGRKGAETIPEEGGGSGGPTGGGGGRGGRGRTRSWARFGREAGQGTLTFAGGWLKTATSIAITAGLLYAGFLVLQKIPPFSEDEIEELVNKLKVIGIGLGAAAAMMGEMYLASLALKGIEALKINFKSFVIGGAILVAASFFVPPFIMAIADFAGASIKDVNVDEVVNTTKNVAAIMASGAVLIGSLVASLLLIGGTGYLAYALANPIGITATLGSLLGGAAIIATAATVLPAFIAGIAKLANATISILNISPEQISKSLNRLIAIMEPFGKLLGYITLIGASMAGLSVGGLLGGAVGGTAYIIGGIAGSIKYLLGGGEYKNYGDVNDVISETLRHYFTLINTTINSISAYMGGLTPNQVIASLNKLQSFDEVNKAMAFTLKDFAFSFGSTVPAYVAIANLSGKLSGISAGTPNEVADKFRGIINIMQGIHIIGTELEQTNVLANIAQIDALRSMLYILSSNAIPLFDGLARIEKITTSKSFQTVASSQATFSKASKILENITPHMGVVLKSIHHISAKIYEELKDLNLQNIKDGSEVATNVVGLFSAFVTSAQNVGKDLSPSKLKNFSATFGSPELVNTLKKVMENTAEMARVFSEGTYSEFKLASIGSKTKYYSQFYSSIADVIQSYGKITGSLNIGGGQSTFTMGNFKLGMARIYDFVTLTDPSKGYSKELYDRLAEEEKKRQEELFTSPEMLKKTITRSFMVIKNMLEVMKDPTVLPKFEDLSNARGTLKGLTSGIKYIAEFSSAFDTNLIATIGTFLTKLEQVPEPPKGAGVKGFSKLSGPFEGMIMTLENMVQNSKSFVDKGSNDFIKMTDVLYELKEPLIKINEIFTELQKIAEMQKAPDFWNTFINSLPNMDSTELKKRMVFLKDYIQEINKITEPSFLGAIMSLSKIEGLSINSKTQSAIELLSNLNNFMNSLRTEVGKTAQPVNAKDKSLVSFDISSMTKFLTENVVPTINSIKDIAEKLNTLPLNTSQIEQASKKMNMLGQIAGSLSDFSLNFYKAATLFNEKHIKVVDGQEYGKYKISKNFVKDYRQGIQNEIDYFEKMTQGLSEQEKLVAISASKIPEAYEELSKSDEQLESQFRNLEKTEGFVPSRWDWIAETESKAEEMNRMLKDPKIKESFGVVGQLPKFFQDNILNPFIAGGGAKLKAGNIQFIATAIGGINDIIKVLAGDDGLINTINDELKNIIKKDVGSSSNLEKASLVLAELGKNNAFASFLNSLLTNVVIPIRFAARISGGPKAISATAESFKSITMIIKDLPDFLRSINTGLAGLGTAKDPSGNLKLAIDNIDKIKNDLPKFLETLSYNVILPSFTKLPPVAFIKQAEKRLLLAKQLSTALIPFINTYAGINATLGTNINQIGLAQSIFGLIGQLSPADEALSSLADKLNSLKESLQTIADSMKEIISINDASGIVNVLSSLSTLPADVANKAKNAAIGVNNMENLKTKVELNNIQNKKTTTDECMETVADNSEASLKKQGNIVDVLKSILSALTSPETSGSSSGGAGSTSNTGSLNLGSGTSAGGRGDGNIFNSSAYGNNMKMPPK